MLLFHAPPALHGSFCAKPSSAASADAAIPAPTNAGYRFGTAAPARVVSSPGLSCRIHVRVRAAPATTPPGLHGPQRRARAGQPGQAAADGTAAPGTGGGIRRRGSTGRVAGVLAGAGGRGRRGGAVAGWIAWLAGRRGRRGGAGTEVELPGLLVEGAAVLRRRRRRAVVHLPVLRVKRAGGAEVVLPVLLVEAAADLGRGGRAGLGGDLDLVAVVVPAGDLLRLGQLADLVPVLPGEDRVLEGLLRQVVELRLRERVPDLGRPVTTETAAGQHLQAL